LASELTLSVLDQSPVRRGGTAAEALQESVKLAQIAEGLGYQRYWVAEHHDSGSFAGTSPELLIGQIAARTHSIRVGSGGVMLTHYSALKVAEQFRLLESFFPGRIDLGIGRAPGSDQRTAAALSYPRPQADVRRFPEQVADLLSFLEGTLDPAHPFSGIRAQPGPVPASVPEVWLLGSSDYSAQLAAAMGLPFAFADFFGTSAALGPFAAAQYLKEFHPSPRHPKPRLNVAIQALCAPTAEEASFLGNTRRLSRANHLFHLDLGPGLLSPEEAAAYPLPDEARPHLERLGRRDIEGDPQQVRKKILATAATYGTNDIAIVTNCYSFESRARSYELVAKAFGLTPRGAPSRP